MNQARSLRQAKKGRKVDPGDNLIMFEAMKMQTFVQAHISGKIKKVNVKQGQMIPKGFVIGKIPIFARKTLDFHLHQQDSLVFYWLVPHRVVMVYERISIGNS